jgi:hypothetical protein
MVVPAMRHPAGAVAEDRDKRQGSHLRCSALRKWLRKRHLRQSVFDVTGSSRLFVLFLPTTNTQARGRIGPIEDLKLQLVPPDPLVIRTGYLVVPVTLVASSPQS